MSNPEELTLEKLFDLIHRKQAESLLALIERGDLTAQEYNSISKFLSDNNITGLRNSNPSLGKLAEGLKAFEEGSPLPDRSHLQ